MKTVIRNEQLAKAVLIIFAVLFFATVYNLTRNLNQQDLLQRIQQGAGNYTLGEIVENDRQIKLASGLASLLGVVLAIVFITWFKRAYTNLSRAGVETQSGPGWAIGAWFVPIVNMFLPLIIMLEIWKKKKDYVANGKTGQDEELVSYQKEVSKGLGQFFILIWWVTYMISAVLSVMAVNRMADAPNDLPSFIVAQKWATFSGYFSSTAIIAALVMMYFMVKLESNFYKTWLASDRNEIGALSDDEEILDL